MARVSAGARAAHGAAREGLGHGTGVPSPSKIHPSCVEDFFKLLPTTGNMNQVNILFFFFFLSGLDSSREALDP